MRKLLALTLIAALLPLAAVAGEQVPYKATLASTSFNVVFPVEGADTGRCAYLPTTDLPPGTGWGLITITAVGNSTLMGLVTDVQSHCTPLPTNPAAPPPPSGMQAPFLLGEATITGANGDSIIGTYEGIMTITDSGMIIDGLLTTHDGTGRFAGAKGVGKAYGVQAGNSAAITLTGTMTSPGAAKKK